MFPSRRQPQYLQNDGVLVTGRGVLDAFDRLEVPGVHRRGGLSTPVSIGQAVDDAAERDRRTRAVFKLG